MRIPRGRLVFMEPFQARATDRQLRIEFLDGLSCTGGVDDPAVWHHFEAEGRLRVDFDSLGIQSTAFTLNESPLVLERR